MDVAFRKSIYSLTICKVLMTFNENVWRVCKRIPKGRVSTYGEIAHALNTKAYRAVGTALNKNPRAPIVPCHRVVNSDGCIGGFAHGSARKQEMLQEEGVIIVSGKVVDFEKKLFQFP
jgi:methylated-DNA-[protein]-cysteine S-methyltransferase